METLDRLQILSFKRDMLSMRPAVRGNAGYTNSFSSKAGLFENKSKFLVTRMRPLKSEFEVEVEQEKKVRKAKVQKLVEFLHQAPGNRRYSKSDDPAKSKSMFLKTTIESPSRQSKDERA